ncbi:MAG TPA: S41 family peptidase [Longimicrobium sp.]|nr:S41 family peptidase [Longimicrobium sp.]
MTRRSIHRGALAAFLALVLLAPALRAQTAAHDRDRARTMLRQVRARIEERFYDPALKGVDLDARAAHANSIIRGATSLADMFSAIAAFTMEMGDSHTFFVPPRQTVESRYGWEMLMVGDSAFVSRVDPESDAARQGVRPGDQVISVNGHTPTRANLWSMWYVFRSLRPQPGLRVVMRAPGGEPRQLDLAARVRRRSRVIDLVAGGGPDLQSLIREEQNAVDEERPRFARLGDVLVWQLRTFHTSDEQIRDGLRRAHGSRALVLDLRGNGGGPPETLLLLLGGLSAERVVVGTLRERRRETPMVAPGTAAAAYTGEMLVLVDSRTASAAEILARVAQLTGRAQVFGDRTAGAVSRGRMEQMEMGVERVVVYGVFVTDAQLVMADGGNLEGVGVAPDTVLLPTAAQLAAGEDPVLAHALTHLGQPTNPAAAGALLPAY